MIVFPLLCAIAVKQISAPTIFFVRKDSIYKSAQGHESLVIKHAVSPAVSYDQKLLAFIREGDLYQYDLAKLELKRCTYMNLELEDVPDKDTYPSWDPTGSYVVFSHPDRYSVIRQGKPVHPMFATEHTMKTVWNVYWCWMTKLDTKTSLSLFLGNETSGTSVFTLASSSSPAFSPDGRRVAFCRNGDLWMATVDPSSIHDLIGEAAWDEARVLTCGTQEGGTRASNETTGIFRIGWSPDGKLLALSTDRYSSTGSPRVIVVRADNPAETVSSFAGSEACFLDSGHVLYVKPYSHTQDIWLRDIASQDEKILIGNGTDPAVAGH
jgi:Tol biopolymer transport system component